MDQSGFGNNYVLNNMASNYGQPIFFNNYQTIYPQATVASNPQPVYIPLEHLHSVAATNKSTKGEERESLLGNNTQASNIVKDLVSNIVKDLYDDVVKFIGDENSESSETRLSSLSKDFIYSKNFIPISSLKILKEIVGLIEKMNAARGIGYDEDAMGSYSYGKANSSSHFNTSARATLFFSFLKKYRLAASETKEKLPIQVTPLLEIFNNTGNLTADNFTKLRYRLAQLFPAFSQLIIDLNYTIIATSEKIQTITSYLYSNEFHEKMNYPEISSTDLKNAFYYKGAVLLNNEAHKVLLGPIPPHKTLFELIQIFWQANSSTYSAGYGENCMLEFEPAIAILNKDYWYLPSDFKSIKTKNSVILLYKLIRQYCLALGNKITPMPGQYLAYSEIKCNNLSLADSFTNPALNEEQYALLEFMDLMDKIRCLKSSSEQEVQSCVDALYPKK